MRNFKVNPWIAWAFGLGSVILANPHEARAAFNPVVPLEVTFSTNATCGETGDVNGLSLSPGATFYVCHKVSNPASNGVTLFNVEIHDSLAPMPNKRTLPPGSFSYYTAGPFVASASTTYSFTVSGNNTAGETFNVGPSAGVLNVTNPGTFTPVLPQVLTFSRDANCGDAGDINGLTVVAGTPVWLCHNITNSPVNGITLYNVQVNNPLAPVTASRTLPPGAQSYYVSQIVASATTQFAFTTTGNNAAGATFLRGPDYGTLNVIAPALTVQKTVSTNGSCPGVESITVLAGTAYKTCYTVTNTGDTAVNGVTLTDNGLSVALGNLAAGASTSYVAEGSATIDASSLASAAGTDAITGSNVVSPPDGAAIDVITPSLAIATTISTSGQCPGQEVVNVLTGTDMVWCYTVTNTGDSTIDNIAIADDIIGGVPGAPFNLAPGQSYTLSRADVSAVDTTLTASARGTVAAVGASIQSNFDPAVVNVVGPRIDIDVTVSTNGQCPGSDVASVPAGTSVVYCYHVTNIGDDRLDDIDLVDQNSLNVGSIATLDVGEAMTITSAPVIVNADGLESITATGTDQYGFGVVASDAAKVHPLFPAVSVVKTASTDGTCPGVELVSVLSGAEVTYCYEVKNTGGTELTNISVNDDGVIIPVEDLAPGATITVSSSITATADVDTSAVASATSPSGAQVSSAPDDAAVDVVSPALVVEKTASRAGGCPGAVELVTVLAGSEIVYCYTVTNTGDALVNGVVVEDDGMTIAIGDLEPGQSGSGNTILTVNADSQTPAVASGTSAPTNTPVVSPPNTAAVDVVAPSLAIQKTVSTDGTCPGVESVSVLAGSEVRYCYSVTNNGDVLVRDVRVEDNGFAIAIGDLAPGQSGDGARTIAVSANESTDAGAIGVCGPTGTNVASPFDGASVEIVHPALAIQKTASSDGHCPGVESVTVLAGAGVTYCYAVTNTGDTAIRDVIVEDNGATIAIGDLGAGQSGSGTANVIANGDARTDATASGVTVATGTNVASAPDGASIDVIYPALAIQKTVSTNGSCPGVESATVLAGTEVTYCYAVTNTGDALVSGVVVSDAGNTIAIGALNPGETGAGSSAITILADTLTQAIASGVVAPTGSSVASEPDGAAVDVVSPSLAIVKTVSRDGTCPGQELVTVLAGSAITYCYAVTNDGDTAVSNVVVSDDAIHLNIGSLGVGQTWTGSSPFTAVTDTSTQAAAVGVATSTGTLVSSPPDGASADVITPALAIAVTVSTNGQCPGQEIVNVLPGTPVTWCYAVTNTGDALIDDVVVTDSQYGVVEGSIPSLQPGESASLQLNVAASTDITLTASAAGVVPATDTRVVSPQDPAVVNVVSPNVDIDVTVSTNGQCPGADNISVGAETDVTYCYLVTNNGDDALSDVTITDPSGGVIGTISALSPGETSTFTSAPVLVVGDLAPSATAAGTDEYGFPVSDSDTSLVHALFAKLQIQKTVSTNGQCPGGELATVLAGTDVTYCYLVTNAGGTGITGILVNDNGRAVEAGSLAPGQSIAVSSLVNVMIDESTDATANGINVANGRPVASAPDGASVDVVAPSLAIQKTVSLNGSCPGSEDVAVLAGTPVTYCYVVTNTGDTTIGDIVVADHGNTISAGTLASGASITLSNAIIAPSDDISTTADASGTDTATWSHVASGPDGALIDVVHPALRIATSVSLDGNCPGSEVVNVLSGTSVTWCYVVTNTGDVAVNNISSLDDTFGAVPGAAFSLAPGASATLARTNAPLADVTIVAQASGIDALVGSAVNTNQDPAVVNVVHPSIDIDVTVSTTSCPGADSITVATGTSVKTCTLVTNVGDDTLSQVVVKNALGQTLFTIPSLASGASYLYQSSAAANGTSSPLATASAIDAYGFPVSDSDSAIIRVNSANLHVVKSGPTTVVQDPPSGCHSGTPSEPINYTITVTNLGPATASNVVLTDPLPAGSSYVSQGSGCGGGGACSYSNGKVTCQLGNLASGQSVTITIKTLTTVTGGLVSNTATATSSTPDSDPSDNSSTWVTRVVNGATRTIGFWGNHPSFVASCLAANNGVIDLGYVKIKDETADNQIDVDNDSRIETGLSLAMGILNANPTKLSNGQSRTSLGKARATAARQVLAAICNATYLGTPPSFDLQAAIATLAGSNVSAINSLNTVADAFNNSGDARSLLVDPGPANSKFPWDDPSDPFN